MSEKIELNCQVSSGDNVEFYIESKDRLYISCTKNGRTLDVVLDDADAYKIVDFISQNIETKRPVVFDSETVLSTKQKTIIINALNIYMEALNENMTAHCSEIVRLQKLVKEKL